MKNFFLVFALLTVVPHLAACSSSPEKRMKKVMAEAERLQPPTTSLSHFAHFELLPIQAIPEITEDEDKNAYADRLEDLLEERIQPLFAGWHADGHSGSGTLRVQPELAGLRIVSGGARFWAGAFAGDSTIDLDLILIQGETGAVVAKPRIRLDSDAWAGGWSIGASDRNLPGYVADIAAQYLALHYGPTTGAP